MINIGVAQRFPTSVLPLLVLNVFLFDLPTFMCSYFFVIYLLFVSSISFRRHFHARGKTTEPTDLLGCSSSLTK
jgi:hypothetical protein